MQKHLTRLFWGLYIIGVLAALCAPIYIIVIRYPDTRAGMLFALACLAYGMGYVAMGEGR